MTPAVVACRPGETLNDAARRMWENDCGFILVTEEGGGALRGVLTDRDALMAAFTRGEPLTKIPVETVLNTELATCGPEDSAAAVQELMRKHRIRRIPVVENGAVIGVISLNDFALAAQHEKKAQQDVATTLAAICEHRQPASSF